MKLRQKILRKSAVKHLETPPGLSTGQSPRPGDLLVLNKEAYLWNLDDTLCKHLLKRDCLVLKVSDEPHALRSSNYPDYFMILLPVGKLVFCNERYLSEVY